MLNYKEIIRYFGIKVGSSKTPNVSVLRPEELQSIQESLEHIYNLYPERK